jgi:hypothetical protein
VQVGDAGGHVLTEVAQVDREAQAGLAAGEGERLVEAGQLHRGDGYSSDRGSANTSARETRPDAVTTVPSGRSWGRASSAVSHRRRTTAP